MASVASDSGGGGSGWADSGGAGPDTTGTMPAPEEEAARAAPVRAAGGAAGVSCGSGGSGSACSGRSASHPHPGWKEIISLVMSWRRTCSREQGLGIRD